jgi:hypothetical protein
MDYLALYTGMICVWRIGKDFFGGGGVHVSFYGTIPVIVLVKWRKNDNSE